MHDLYNAIDKSTPVSGSAIASATDSSSVSADCGVCAISLPICFCRPIAYLNSRFCVFRFHFQVLVVASVEGVQSGSWYHHSDGPSESK